jgi:biopolymer transport protein ExbD
MKFLPKKHEPEELNISPLIDMVFILLIFFAVSTTFVKDMQLELQRPSAQSSIVASSKAIRVYIDRSGGVFMDEQAVKPWMLQSLVRDHLAVSSSGSVLIIADRLTPTEKLVEVVDQCKLAGAAEVGVATEAR